MTRSFNAKIKCPKCGHMQTQESAFERWMRNNPELDSNKIGLVRYDCDMLLHRYKTDIVDKRGSRDLQFLMFVEIKTFGAEPTPAQQDTLSMLSQVLRNRSVNMHQSKLGMHATDHVPITKCKSRMFNREITLRMYGGHLLQLEKDDPINSDWIKWDWKEIDTGILTQLLRFEIDPDTLRKVDFRRRSSSFPQKTFTFFETKGNPGQERARCRP